jgi:hypothetical protein
MIFFLAGAACVVYALVSTNAIFGGLSMLAALICFLTSYYALQGGA